MCDKTSIFFSAVSSYDKWHIFDELTNFWSTQKYFLVEIIEFEPNPKNTVVISTTFASVTHTLSNATTCPEDF